MGKAASQPPSNSHADLARAVVNRVRGGGFGKGDRLGETAFAETLGVSRTPVRAAFALLFDAGVLAHEPGRGYFLALPPEAIPDDLGDTLSSAEGRLAERILADRASRRLDADFTVAALARRYGLPRNTVLNTLKVLQEDGLVTPTKGRSWAFRPLLDTQNALVESVDYRLLIEPAAITAPGFRMDVSDARQVRSALTAVLESPAPRRFMASDVAFHDLVARASGNRFLRDTLLAHNRLRTVGDGAPPVTAFRMEQATGEHLAILDSLENGQFDLAATQMALHLRRARIQRPQTANRGSPPLVRSRGGLS